MLPSRLFRNTGIPPTLRSLIIPHASLPSNVAVQLRLRLGVIPGSVPSASRSLGTNASASHPPSPPSAEKAPVSKPTAKDSIVHPPPPASASGSSASTSRMTTTDSQALPEKMEPKLSLTFTCTVSGCGERSTHQFTKQAYEKGVVLVQCPGCKNRHLIADHLGWFKDSTKGGKAPTVEDILREKGENVRRGSLSANGDVAYFE
ncbi:hypothetical protein CVT25_010062 [Psilocybe cyanescens]|uniref:DNL-type domain-containing protein n=1 Tax=Psilocybe cyanescens TaxID=93625 RepID=A0A409X3G1_PSICY|nr:hypothetical protein CVT25_010062 [Psilocybe cyanescens]